LRKSNGQTQRRQPEGRHRAGYRRKGNTPDWIGLTVQQKPDTKTHAYQVGGRGPAIRPWIRQANHTAKNLKQKTNAISNPEKPQEFRRVSLGTPDDERWLRRH